MIRYPKPIPVGTAIPVWAFLDVTESDTFDVTEAEAEAAKDLPDLPGGIEPTQLGTAVPSSTNKVPKESDQSNPNYTAAIIGGVTGGIAGLVILVLAILWQCRRRTLRAAQRKEILPASTHQNHEQGHYAEPLVEQRGLHDHLPRLMPVTSLFGMKLYVSPCSVQSAWYMTDSYLSLEFEGSQRSRDISRCE